MFHGPIPRQLALRLRPGLFRRMPAGQGIAALHVAGNLRGHADADSAPAHFGKAYRATPAIRLVDEVFLALMDFIEWPGKVAVPLQRVHGQVEMSVKNEHGPIDKWRP